MKKIIFSERAIDFLPEYEMVNGVLYLFDADNLKKSLLEDVPELYNEKSTILLEKIKRYQNLVRKLKNKYDNKCQLCGFTFEKQDGSNYSEAHHIVRLADNGSQGENNVIIVCPNHHRMLHYGKDVDYYYNGEILKTISINGKYISIFTNN